MHIQYCDEITSENDRTLIGSALLYFISSADLIPDYLFPIGYLDDAIVVYLVLDRLEQRLWRVWFGRTQKNGAKFLASFFLMSE